MALVGTIVPDNTLSFRNRIINGDMRIDQRNAGAEVNPATHNGYQLDRWTTFMDAASKFKIQQLTTSPPPGFTHYLSLTVTNAYTSTTTERFALMQKIEGFNVSDLGYGTAAAKTMTLSFWVRSSLTGTFGGTIHNEGGSTYKMPFNYSISSANTWEYKTVLIPGLTAEAIVNTTISTGMRVWFDLGSNNSATAGTWIAGNYYTGTGAQKWLTNAGATLDLTGVQLEVGSVATPFERRPYGMELQLCQRYFTRFSSFGSNFAGIGSGVVEATTGSSVIVKYPVTMRTSPTASQSSTGLYDGGSVRAVTSLSTNYQGPDALNINITASGGGLTIGRGSTLVTNGSSGYFDLSAEL